MSGASPQHRTLRRRIEQGSRPLLVQLHGLPRLVVPLATVALVAIGILAPPPVGLAALTLVFLFIAWVAYLSWPVVPLSGRLLRLLMLALVVVIAVTRP